MLVDDVSFQVRGGEIYALAGVQGNGQTEMTEALVGLTIPTSGKITIAGSDVTTLSTDAVLDLGVGYVPEDRLHDGLVGDFSVAENLVLDLYDQPPFASGPAMNLAAIARNATERVDEFDVRTSSTTASANTLSGGNQQKVVLARELSRPLKLLIVAQPTRGLDVGSIEFIHAQLVAQRAEGKAILLISAELDEILALADRIAVLYWGRLAAILPRATATRERLGLLMAGGSED
ncbi:MAG TPA: ATP-binding cassette domain-containing protein [Acidimicrobiales bacterium]|nr:ATP-binding cassette domain-containing protein [Acidimicrobiales bacterium]